MNGRGLASAILVLILPSAGCKGIPRSGMPTTQFASLGCAEVQGQLGQTRVTLHAAMQARSDAWHLMVPPLVLARYVHAYRREIEARSREGKLLREQQGRCLAAERMAWQ
jgi:hypothetical protein